MKLIDFISILCLFLTRKHVFGDDIPLTEKEILNLRQEVKSMFYHAYDGYMKYAIPYDELRPLTCDGHDTWGSYSLTLIDALDTLAVMDNKTEFQRVFDMISVRKDFEADINVSVFETNIRIVGGLLGAHLLARRMGVAVGENWPCEGPLLSLAADAATRLLPAFDTPTGMPYGTVNLRHGVPEGETPVTCAAGVGTFVIEFGTLSRLTGDPIFEDVSLRAMHSLWNRKSRLNLIGNHIDVLTGHWTGNDAGIGAGVDSFFEYLLKGSILLQRPELKHMFDEARSAIDRHLRHEDWHLWKSMQRAQVSMAVFQSLEAFWPGVLTLAGDVASAQKTLFNYHQVMKQYGFTPEFYSIPQSAAYAKRSGYPLRPEMIESLTYLYQATRDSTFLKMGADLVAAIEHSAKTKCGYATIENVVDHSLDNRMESFFLAETTKYLYLLFHEDHWLHSSGAKGTPLFVQGRYCVVGAGGNVFNSEAHPMDPGALACCSGPKVEDFLPQEDLVNLLLDPSSYSKGDVETVPLVPKDRPKEVPLNEIRSLEEKEIVRVGITESLEDKKRFSYSVGKGTVEEVKMVAPEVKIVPPEVKVVAPEVKIVPPEADAPAPEVKTAPPEIETAAPQVRTAPPPTETESPPSSETRESSASDVISVEKDRNESVYEGLLISLQKAQKEEDSLPWGPRFTAMGEGGGTKGGGMNPPVGEAAEVSSSVSSSKFSAVGGSENRIVEKEVELPKKEFSLPDLRQRLEEVRALQNWTDAVSYSVLSCPVSFKENFSFKGQMIV